MFAGATPKLYALGRFRLRQMELPESRYIDNQPEKQRFCVSTQHYTFAANAFAELVKQFGQERSETVSKAELCAGGV